jgi:tetratricopeptide (TPR) repeat protein
MLERKTNMENTNTIKELISQAMGAYKQENFKKSIAIFSELLTVEPAHKLSLVGRGSAFLRLNGLDNALADFDRAVGLYPDYARAYHLRGLVKAQQGHDLAALEDFDKAIELDTDYGAAYASRAATRLKLGQEDLAAEDMATVITSTQVNLETYANENNIWHTHHMREEAAEETELKR